MRLAMLALAMADPTSTPLPAYMTPFGETPEPRIYLVERLTPEEMHELEAAQPPPSEDDEALDLAPAANDSVDRRVDLLLFIGSSHLSRRMLRTARDLVTRIGERSAALRVVDVADGASAPEVAKHRVVFTPTLVLDTGETLARVVGAASLHALAEVLPDFAALIDED